MADDVPIFLVGMPGSGKSYLGSRLANDLQRPFVDLDNFIESKESVKIQDLLDPNDESEFRALEHKYLLELLETLEDHVVALGGGTPCFFDHMSLLNDAGTTVYLDIDLDKLASAISTGRVERPLMLGEGSAHLSLRALHNERRRFYEQSAIKVRAGRSSTEDALQQIMDELGMN